MIRLSYLSYSRGLGTMPGSEHVVKVRFTKAAVMVTPYVNYIKMFLQPEA